MQRTLAWVCAITLLALSVLSTRLVHDLPRLRVTTKEVSKGQIDAPIVLTGSVRAAAPVSVSAPVAGAVRSIEFGVNSIVRAGEVLARIDAAAYAGPLAAAEAELDQARAEALREREELDRQCFAEEQLTASPVLERAKLEATEAAVQGAVNDVRASEERLSRARAALARARAEQQEAAVRAPVAGMIVSIAPGEPTFRILPEVGHVEVAAPLTVRDARAVQVGDVATILLGAEALPGRVTSIEQGAGPMLTAIVQVPASLRELPPGAHCAIAFDGSRRRSTVRIPNEAFAFTPPAEVLEAVEESHVPTVALASHPAHPLHVWVYDGGFTRVEVVAGDHDARFTELVEGPVRPGDAVVTGVSVGGE